MVGKGGFVRRALVRFRIPPRFPLFLGFIYCGKSSKSTGLYTMSVVVVQIMLTSYMV